MTLERLRAGLADLAQEADSIAHVDLRPAVRRTSRRLRLQRVVAATAAAVATIALSGVALANLSGPHRSAPLPAATVAATTAPASTGTPRSVFYLTEGAQRIRRLTVEGSLATQWQQAMTGSETTITVAPNRDRYAA